MKSFLKKLKNLWRLAGLIEVVDNGRSVILSFDKNLVINSDQSILIHSPNGYLVEYAKQIHANPNITVDINSVSAIMNQCDIAVAEELARLERERPKLKLKVKKQGPRLPYYS